MESGIVISLKLIRLGGLAAMGGGVANVTLGLVVWLCTFNCPRSLVDVLPAFFVLLVFGAMAAIATLHPPYRAAHPFKRGDHGEYDRLSEALKTPTSWGGGLTSRRDGYTYDIELNGSRSVALRD